MMRSGDHIFCDQYSHASIVDGAILAKSKTVFFRHNNPLDLERKLTGVKGKKLVVVEGVYSMDGDVCLLPEIVEVAKRHGARILIDEAHSTFLFGANGRGVAEHFGLDKEVDFHLGTFSKSLGGQGGFVCGSRDLVDYVNAFGRSRFFSCNLAPAIAAGLLAGLRIVEREPQLRARLWSNVAFLRRRFAEEGIDIGKSNSQVMPVMVNNDGKVLGVAEKIQDRGLFLQPVAYPAVPKHKSRLRVSVSAAHRDEELETALQTFKASRDLAIERWHLRHWRDGVEVGFDRQGKAITARVRVDGSPVAELTITDHSWSPVSHLYQAFMKDEQGAYLASITMEGRQSEHEEETGRISLYEHPFNKDLAISEIYEQPFREMWMREGRQTFEPLIQLQTV